MTGAELIAEERQRQIEKEGFSADHDQQHNRGELALAGAAYALDYANQPISRIWPWRAEYWKPRHDLPIRQLIKAGALIAAEIDRLQSQGVKSDGRED